MKIYLGADYRGFETKNELLRWLKQEATAEVYDLGAYTYEEGDDFNEPAIKVARAVQNDENSFGILVCDSAHGVTIEANRFKGVRAAHCENEESAKLAREHDNANILCLSAHFLTPEKLVKIVNTFISTKFTPLERRLRRITKLDRVGEEKIETALNLNESEKVVANSNQNGGKVVANSNQNGEKVVANSNQNGGEKHD